MPHRWRWDQGRLDYFNFNSIRRIASALTNLNGIDLKLPDPLRVPMEQVTGLPFHPNTYSVWRNYARVFKCQLLAARIGNRLITTDLCRQLADDSNQAWDVDQYLSFVAARFYAPSPMFARYEAVDDRVFPFCAVLRYLLAMHNETGDASITLDQVFSLIIGNGCRGTEPLGHYLSLRETNYSPQGDEQRQVREMLIFLSQISFLAWHRNILYLDVLSGDEFGLERILDIATPVIRNQQPDPDAEIISLGTISEGIPLIAIPVAGELPSDISFIEGRRMRVTHLRVERSPRLRRLFFDSLDDPVLCNMCNVNTSERYPWTINLLEVHHLLPLSSVLAFNGTETSFADLVPLCPNCHKSVHVFYSRWLGTRGMDDFSSTDEAKDAYAEARNLIRL